MDAEELLELWDRQQTAQTGDPRPRRDLMADLIGTRGITPVIVELGTGTGALAAHLLEALPGAHLLAVDHDPALMELASRRLTRFADRVTLIDADLTRRDWIDHIGSTPDAVVSETLWHWFSPAQQIALCERIADLLPAGALLLAAESAELRARGSLLDLALTEERHRRASWAAPSWSRWWELAERMPELTPLIDERHRRFAALGREEDSREFGPAFIPEILRMAGFAQAEQLWQHLDQQLVAARR